MPKILRLASLARSASFEYFRIFFNATSRIFLYATYPLVVRVGPGRELFLGVLV